MFRITGSTSDVFPVVNEIVVDSVKGLIAIVGLIFGKLGLLGVLRFLLLFLCFLLLFLRLFLLVFRLFLLVFRLLVLVGLVFGRLAVFHLLGRVPFGLLLVGFLFLVSLPFFVGFPLLVRSSSFVVLAFPVFALLLFVILAGGEAVLPVVVVRDVCRQVGERFFPPQAAPSLVALLGRIDHLTLLAVCVDRSSGKILWQTEIFSLDKPAGVHLLNSFATPTPVVEPGRLYCDFGAYGTACVDSETGKILWKEQLVIDHQVGPGSSPILVQDLLVLVRDGRDLRYVAALDKKTGKTVWKTDRPPVVADRGDQKKSFCTPLVVQTAGRLQMIAPGPHWMISYDPLTGKEFWRMRHGDGYSLAPRPVFANDMAYICTGASSTPGLMALRVDGQGDVTSSALVWRVQQQTPRMSSPLVVGKELYYSSDAGVISRFDAVTGKPLGRCRADGKIAASPIYADGHVYFVTHDGKTVILESGKEELKPVAANRLEGIMFASPIAVGKTLFFRNETHLYRVEKRQGPVNQ